MKYRNSIYTIVFSTKLCIKEYFYDFISVTQLTKITRETLRKLTFEVSIFINDTVTAKILMK